jgi:hypothetical protein
MEAVTEKYLLRVAVVQQDIPIPGLQREELLQEALTTMKFQQIVIFLSAAIP